MGRKEIHPSQRKVSLTLSVPFFIWEMAKENGNKSVSDLIILGKWAKDNNINHLSLLELNNNYESKIMKLQEVISNGNR